MRKMKDGTWLRLSVTSTCWGQPSALTIAKSGCTYIDNCQRAKRKLSKSLKQKEWGDEHIKESTAQVSELSKRDKWSTVKKGRNNFIERRRWFTPEDNTNESNINAKVKELFLNNHYPPEGWHRFSENKNTVCEHVMGSVSLSHGQDTKRYWEDFAGEITNRCWIDLRTIRDKHVSKVCRDETLVASRRDDIVWIVITCC